MNRNKTKVSVIMGFYNNESTLARAINSILNQTYDKWELIMCDDGSTDHSYSIAEEYLKQYPDRIKLLQNTKNRHLANALNRCLKVASGEYIARMDADDESLPQRFELQAEFLDSHSEYILCGTGCLMFDEITQSERIINCVEKPNKYTMYNHTPFNHATIMCRRQMYKELGGYSESACNVRCEDKDLWYRFFTKNYKGYNIHIPLYKVYEDEASIFRRTPRSRWNIFITNLKGYKLLRYPWYWYYKPFISFMKLFIPRKLQIMYKKMKRKVT